MNENGGRGNHGQGLISDYVRPAPRFPSLANEHGAEPFARPAGVTERHPEPFRKSHPFLVQVPDSPVVGTVVLSIPNLQFQPRSAVIFNECGSVLYVNEGFQLINSATLNQVLRFIPAISRFDLTVLASGTGGQLSGYVTEEELEPEPGLQIGPTSPGGTATIVSTLGAANAAVGQVQLTGMALTHQVIGARLTRTSARVRNLDGVLDIWLGVVTPLTGGVGAGDSEVLHAGESMTVTHRGALYAVCLTGNPWVSFRDEYN